LNLFKVAYFVCNPDTGNIRLFSSKRVEARTAREAVSVAFPKLRWGWKFVAPFGERWAKAIHEDGKMIESGAVYE